MFVHIYIYTWYIIYVQVAIFSCFIFYPTFGCGCFSLLGRLALPFRLPLLSLSDAVPLCFARVSSPPGCSCFDCLFPFLFFLSYVSPCPFPFCPPFLSSFPLLSSPFLSLFFVSLPPFFSFPLPAGLASHISSYFPTPFSFPLLDAPFVL